MNLRKLQLNSEIRIFKISGGFFRNRAQTNQHYAKYYKSIKNDIFNFTDHSFEKYPIFRATFYKSYKAISIDDNLKDHKILIIIYLIDEKKYTTISEDRYMNALKHV